MENENKKNNKFLYIICTILAIAILSYSIFWFVVYDKYKKQMVEKLKETKNLTYSSISPSGFPFRFGLKFNDLKFEENKNNQKATFKTDEIVISKSFTSNYMEATFSKITIDNNGQSFEILLDKNSNSKIKIDNNELKSIDMIAPKITIKNLKNKSKESVIKNLTYKTEIIRNDSYENKPSFIDIENISNFSIQNGKRTLIREFNASLNFSLINILNGKDIVSSGLEMEKFVLNNITDNYSINVVGSSKMDGNNNNATSLDIYLKNYSNLLKSIKDPVHLGTAQLIQNSIPDINNQGNDKHIKIEKEIDSNTIRINGKDINEIIASMTSAAQMLNPNNFNIK